MKSFQSDTIEYWCHSLNPDDEDPGGLRTDDEPFQGETAICPHCDYDTVIGDASGLTINEENLVALKAYWQT